MTLVCKILLVDDHDDIRRLVATALSNEGYRVEAAKDAVKARRAIARGSYDLVIADVTLPRGEDGISLAAHAREQGCGVILISGSYAAEERLKGSGLAYLMKPFRVASLLAAVRNALAERSAERGAIPATECPADILKAVQRATWRVRRSATAAAPASVPEPAEAAAAASGAPPPMPVQEGLT